MKILSLFPLLLSWLLLLPGGCKLGPDYHRPEVETPSNWLWKEAKPRDEEPRTAWWKIFNDPALDILMEQAITNNLGLQAAFARVEQARATARIDRSAFYPALTSEPGWVRYRTSGNAPSPVPFPVPSFTQQQWSVPFDLSYEVDLWGRVRRSFESAQQLAMASEAARQSVLLTLQGDVAGTYFSLQIARRELELRKRGIEIRKEAQQIFTQRLEAGLGSSFEVQRGKVEVAAAEADFQAAERRYIEFFNALAVLCGKPPANFDFKLPAATLHIPEIAPDLPSSLLERRPDIAQAERELASRSSQIGVAKAAFFPSVKLTASGGVLSGELSDLFKWDSRTWSIGPSISIPIFQKGRSKATVERSKAAYEESVAIYREKVLVAFREVEDSIGAITRLKLEGEARRIAAEAATGASGLALDRYRAGTISFLEVVDAENVRLINEVGALRAHNEQLVATVRLIKALGGGW